MPSPTPSLRGGYPPPQPHLVDGESLTWFGARTAPALRYWRELRADLLA